MMDNNNTNDYSILGTLVNADSSGIIARSSQIYDAVAGKSVEDRITELDKKVDKAEKGLQAEVNGNTLLFTNDNI